MKRLLAIAAVFCLAAVHATAQRSFKGLTPGVSTRDDVARVLGAPSRTLSTSMAQYRGPAAGLARVEVTYDSRDVAQRIEVYLDPPVTRRGTAANYDVSLPDGRGDRDGRLVEYFAGEKLIAFNFVGQNADSGVDSVDHFSAEAFTEASGIPLSRTGDSQGTGNQSTGQTQGQPGGSGSPGTPAPKGKAEKTVSILNGISSVLGAINTARGQRAGWNVGNQASLEGIYLSQYQSPSADRCQADCGSNASCRAYVFVRAGNPNPGDPSMCYLMSSATRAVASPCCVAGVKTGGQ
jgi:hypothetical protein